MIILCETAFSIYYYGYEGCSETSYIIDVKHEKIIFLVLNFFFVLLLLVAVAVQGYLNNSQITLLESCSFFCKKCPSDSMLQCPARVWKTSSICTFK